MCSIVGLALDLQLASSGRLEFLLLQNMYTFLSGDGGETISGLFLKQ